MTAKMEATAGVSAADLLRDDHRKVKQLFSDFEETDDQSEKQDLVNKAIQELKIHTMLEEELFYPAVRKTIGDDELVNEAEEEHHVAKSLIGELEDMSPDDGHFDAKFIVLAESVRHHIEEEENEMLPEAEKSGVDMFELGEQLAQRRQEILGEGHEETSAGHHRGKRPAPRSSKKSRSNSKTH